jgi:hypothetical protein
MPSSIAIINQAGDAALEYFQMRRGIYLMHKEHAIPRRTIDTLLYCSHLEDKDGLINFTNVINDEFSQISSIDIQELIKHELLNKHSYGVYRVSNRGRIFLKQLLDLARSQHHKRTRWQSEKGPRLKALNAMKRVQAEAPKEDTRPSLPWL